MIEPTYHFTEAGALVLASSLVLFSSVPTQIAFALLLVSLVTVVGAHLSGQPLNHQLTALGGRFVRAGYTAPAYRLFALPGTTPPKPGLLRVRDGGVAIEIEVWALPRTAFGAFFRNVTPPLGIGTLLLDNGDATPGFICEPLAIEGARDISALGGWRAYLAAPRA